MIVVRVKLRFVQIKFNSQPLLYKFVFWLVEINFEKGEILKPPM